MIHLNGSEKTDGYGEKFARVWQDVEKAVEELTAGQPEETGLTEGEQPEDQAVAFHRPQVFALTAIHEEIPSQGLFYRNEKRPFLRLWIRNACNVELTVGQEKYIFLEVDRNVWELTLSVEPGFYYVTLSVDGVEALNPFLPIGYGNSRPCNYLDIGPLEPFLETRKIPHGSIRHEYFYSEVTKRNETCLIYAPPGYEDGRNHYPVLYLQHGFGENETSWVWQGRIGHIMDNLLCENKAAPMLIVMADGMLRDQEERLKQQLFPEFLTGDLLPFVESRYRVKAGKDNRAIAGLSMGSMQASMTAFDHPGKFGWIGLFSGFMRNYIGVEEVDDGHLQTLLCDPQKFNRENRLLFRAIGKEDVFFHFFMEEDQISEDYQIRQVRRVYEGGHDWNVWRRCAYEFLQMIFA